MALYRKLLGTIYAITILLSTAMAQTSPQPHYLITNNDLAQGNSASFYGIKSDGVLRAPQLVQTGGTGVNGVGAVATKRVSLLDNSTQSCAFVSDAASVDVAGISVTNLHLTGTSKLPPLTALPSASAWSTTASTSMPASPDQERLPPITSWETADYSSSGIFLRSG